MHLTVRLFAMATGLRVGQQISGKLSTYTIMEKMHESIWITTNAAKQKIIIKLASDDQLNNELRVLQTVTGNPCIRPLIDTIKDPPSLVLKHLDDHLLVASNTKRLDKPDIKFVARNVLTALDALHQQGYVHTGQFQGQISVAAGPYSIIDVRPNNVLVNHGSDSARFSEVHLGDFGDTCMVDPNIDSLQGHGIGAAIFRSPEAILNLRWNVPTDIWSFGAMLISLIWGDDFHIFMPDNTEVESADFPFQVLVKQASYFGPVPINYQDIADDERLGTFVRAMQFIIDNKLHKPFRLAVDKELSKKDRTFNCKIMKLDPRDRPTAKELLQDEWFRED